MAKLKVVVCNDSTLGNTGLECVAKTSMCQIFVPMPRETVGGEVEGRRQLALQCLADGTGSAGRVPLLSLPPPA